MRVAIEHQVKQSAAMAEATAQAQSNMGQGLNALPYGASPALIAKAAQVAWQQQQNEEWQQKIADGTLGNVMTRDETNRARARASGYEVSSAPALKPGDLDYVRSRIKRMAAFLADDRKSQVVVDSALIMLLDRHLNGN